MSVAGNFATPVNEGNALFEWYTSVQKFLRISDKANSAIAEWMRHSGGHA